MQLDKTVWSFRVFRASSEQRKEKPTPPPYLTSEGFSIIDRRMKNDRRENARDTERNFNKEFRFFAMN